MKDDVVVTGIGVLTPIGIGVEAFSEGLREGRSGVRPIRAFQSDGLPTRIAGEIDEEDFDPSRYIRPPKAVKTLSRAAQFAVAASELAWEHAGLGEDSVDPYRLGISLGVGGMGPVDLDMMEDQARAALSSARRSGTYEFDVPGFAREYLRGTNPLSALRGLPNLAAAQVAIQHNARGPSTSIATACTSGTQALGEALRMIRSDGADVMLAGGTDAMINPVGVVGFSMLGTLSRRNDDPGRASRPFDADRDGFVMGEGACLMVLERRSHAEARGAQPLAEIAGFAATCDAYRITDERPDTASASQAMHRAMADAGMEPADFRYINAHGTGTRMNDITETRAVRDVFGGHAGDVAISSTKSMMGHLLAAAGAVETAAAILGMIGGFLPPTINLETPDPECDLDYVPLEARSAAFDAALSNSFGFGGQNACLAIRRA